MTGPASPDPPPPVAPPLPAGPVAPPPDQLLKRLQESRDECLRDAQAHLNEAADSRRFGKNDGLARTLAQVHHYFAKRFEELLGEAPRGAARPPQPQHEGDVFDLAALLLKEAGYHASHRVFQASVEALRAARPPASPPALEALKGHDED